MADTIMVQIRFDLDENGGQDALYYTLDDYSALDQKTLDAAKQVRIDAYKFLLDNPPAPVELTKEDLEAEKQQFIEEQKAFLDNLDEKIAVASASSVVSAAEIVSK